MQSPHSKFCDTRKCDHLTAKIKDERNLCVQMIRKENTLLVALPVVHHQNLKLACIVHNKLLESIGKIVTGLLVGPVSNVGHQDTSLELSSNSRINTFWSAPAWLY